jgi:hypothetical protein
MMRIFPKVSVNSSEAGGCPSGRSDTKWAEAGCRTKKLFPFCYNAVGQHFSPSIQTFITIIYAMPDIVWCGLMWDSTKPLLLSAACYTTSNLTQ